MSLPTIRDVAREAGVGVGTVSRVLNNSQQVSAETRERVMQAIQKLGFRPNPAARQLSLGVSVRNLGVILPFITSHSFVERLKGVQLELTEHGQEYDLVLYNVSSLERYHEQLIAIVQGGLVDGLLIMDLDLSAEQTRMLEEAGIPFVGINGHRSTSWPSIAPDNLSGGVMAVEYLIEHGHRRIAYVGDEFPDDFNFPTSQLRYEGYKQALAQAGIDFDPDYVRLGQYGRDVAQALTDELLALPHMPTAIFAMSDIQAGGCLTAIRAHRMRVPDDISVIGFDDIEISAFMGLTTVRQHLQASGQLAMQYLLALLRHGDTGLPPPALPPLEVIERHTTGAPAE